MKVFIDMKAILLTVLMAITSYGAGAQDKLIDVDLSIAPTQEELLMSEEVLDTVPVLYNQFRDYVEFQQQHQRMPEHRPMPFSYLPRPKEVIKRGDKVMVVYDRKEWERFMIARKVHFRRMMQHKK